MASVSGPGVSVSYEYDADGRRVKEVSGGATKQYLIDRLLPYGQVVVETNGSGNLNAEYVYGLERVSQERGGVRSYFLADGQGSVRQLTDSVGNVTDTYDYTAFGEALASTGTTENEFRYVGEQADANSGFYYLRKRWMDQAAGRFVSVDPFEGGIARPLSLNKYLYAEASPAWMTDPTGLFGLSEALGALTLNSILTSMARPQSRMLNYILHFRLFAPWETFGFGFGGDSRSFSTSTDPSVTSRVNSTVTIDVAGNRVLGSRGWSDPSHWGPFTRTGTPSVSVNRTGAANSRTIEVSGANPLFGDEAPPIDATLTLYWRLKDSGGACFDGVVVGDAFPNAEVFVERQGKKTSLHTFETSGDRNLGPLNYLPGKNSRSMGNFKDRCAN